MPELPEVETVRRSLEPHLRGRRIDAVRILRADIVHTGSPQGWLRRSDKRNARPDPGALLLDAHITELRRHGKQLAILSGTHALCIHLGMTGQLVVADAREAPGIHTHIIWTLDNGAALLFRDPRRFGGVGTFERAGELEAFWSTLGPDAARITAAQLAAALDGSRRAVKSALLDQRAIAGVGNIYADEALYAARIRPRAPAHRLTPDRTSALARAIRGTLARAIKAGGSTLRDYVDGAGEPGRYQSAHKVYGRAGEPCFGCGRPLRSGVLAQRATVWCARCQV